VVVDTFNSDNSNLMGDRSSSAGVLRHGQCETSHLFSGVYYSPDVDVVLKRTFEPTISQVEEIVQTEKACARSINTDANGCAYMPLSNARL